MRLFTYTLSSGDISIGFQDGVTQISIQASAAGTCIVTGNIPFKGLTPNQITINNGQSLTIMTPTSSPLDGVVISHVAGDIDILIGF